MGSLPFEIKKQMVQCFGTAFHFKDQMESFLLSAGLDQETAGRHRDKAKFVWARNLLADLERTEDGLILQRRILTELCKLRNLPDEKVPNPDAGLAALRKLKTLAMNHDLLVKSEKKESSHWLSLAEQRVQIIKERTNKLEHLKKEFFAGMCSSDRQQAGYTLEDILEQLFPLFEIEYRKSYRTSTQQIDGHFRFEGFDYLVEAKWRKDQPNESEIAGFKRKIETKFDATRGVLISINGVRAEVIDKFQGERSNILFMDGEDLILILEGRVDLRELLEKKIEKAAQEGIVYWPARNMI
jgi:restriction endonuclease Mrr